MRSRWLVKWRCTTAGVTLVQTLDAGRLRKPLKVMCVGLQRLRGAVGYPAVEEERLNYGLEAGGRLNVGFIRDSSSERIFQNLLWY